MARSISDLYTFYLYIVRKERGVFVTPAQFTANLDAGQMDCFEEWFKPYGENQEIHDALRPFRVYQQFTSSSSGFVTYPDGYMHLLGTPFTVTGSTVNTVKFVNEDELSFALTSQLRAVTTAYPIAVDSNTGFSIYPQSQQTGAYFYLRRPIAPIYGFSQVGRVITYNSATSVQLEWNEIYINNIIAKSLRYAGINMNDEGVAKFAEIYNQETK